MKKLIEAELNHELGSDREIGEIVGAVFAVLGTLYYLAAQIRTQNQQARKVKRPHARAHSVTLTIRLFYVFENLMRDKMKNILQRDGESASG